jgi:hypothetical protein
MEGRAGHRLVSARSGLALGALAFALIIVGLVLAALAGQSAAQVISTATLVPTVAVGPLVAARRPGNTLGQRLGLPDPNVQTTSTCVDSRRQWRHARNVWHNSMIRSVLQTLTFRRRVKNGVKNGVKAQAAG